MANVVGFALDIAINVAVLATVFGGEAAGPVVKIGTGSIDLPGLDPPPPTIPNNEQPGGPMPLISLYDVHGQNFATDTAFGDTMVNSDTKKVNFQGGLDSSNLATTPEYMRLLALQADPVCVSWVTVAGTDGTRTSWHAGYAQQCNVPAWYPSPDLFPSTTYRPGCVWLTNQKDFPGLQAISFRLTDLSFQSTAETNAARLQFTSNPDTLCKAPGRMAFWETADPLDCIPFYDFVEKKDEKEGPTNGFDADPAKIMTGHTLKCKPTGTMFTPSNYPTPNPTAVGVGNFGGVLGSIPASEAGKQPVPPPPSTTLGVGNFGGVLGSIPIEDAGQPDELAPPSTTLGAGNFGGVQGSIPIGEAGQQEAPAPTPPAEGFQGNAGNQGALIVSINPGGPTGVFQAVTPAQTAMTVAKSKSRRRSLDHTSILEHRAVLQKKHDFCVDRLTISHLFEHTATSVCQSESSWGPDFVSVVEGLYCDMCEKMLWNLCSGPADSYCFDLAARELRFSGGLGPRDLNSGSTGEEDLMSLRKKYAKVQEWTE